MPVAKQYISYLGMQETVHSLVEHMMVEKYKPKMIVAIAKGGVIPAGMLMQIYPDAKLNVIQVVSYEGVRKTEHILIGDWNHTWNSPDTLFIDEICDTGGTFECLRKRFYHAKFAACYNRQNAIFHPVRAPDFVGQSISTDAWLVFPWELDSV
jgi:hypoxanthine phosphoribosyltransferase